MPVPLLVFYTLAALIVGSALLMVTRRNAIVAALCLAVSLLAVGALYVSLLAEFLFAVQVLVYTGGVMVLFLFVIMLMNVDELEHLRMASKRWAVAVALLAVTFGVLTALATSGAARPIPPAATAEPVVGGNTRAVASALFTGYLLPFEIVSIYLLVAMVGAIVLAKKEG